jgi:phenylpyruvate tautomerase PptA (4-oxalocrotonate tautomerase family)
VVGGSIRVKKKRLDELMETLTGAGFNRENVMVVFKEIAGENWAFGGGRLIHA